MYMGAVVRSRSGRDRYRLYVVIGVTEDGRVLIADGRLHPLQRPKRKNLRHLTVLAAGPAAGFSWDTDDAVYGYLQDFEKAHKNHEETLQEKQEQRERREA